MNEPFSEYWPVYLLVAIGALLVILASIFIGTEAVVWISAFTGVAIGMAIAAINRKQR